MSGTETRLPYQASISRASASVQDQRSEWAADAVVHALSIAFSLFAGITLLGRIGPDAASSVAISIYVAGLFLMTSCSAIYNLSNSSSTSFLRRLDHAAIFFMIAGTYTPFSVMAIPDPRGTEILAFVWTVALIGAALKLLAPQRFESSAIAVYLLLGWTGLLVIDPLLMTLSPAGMALLGSGGVLYSIGLLFHLWTRLPYHTAVWHLFVLSGAACHYVVILHLVGPST